MTQQTDLKHIESQSMSLTEHNIEQLKQLFPNVFSEGKIDFDALKSELGEFAETDNERYQFTWNGKEQAKRIATTPTLGTLRPAPEESVNWDATENLYIEGDNLEVLKLLQKSYFGKVKMIYIDPPYNTGKDFVYKDDFKDNLANYQRLTGQKDEEGNPLFTNSDSSGRYHSNWLNMMYPRLKLARNLLRDDGVIFISIDDNEVHNLKKACDEIFGEGNFICTISRTMKTGGAKGNFFTPTVEFLLVYAKNIDKAEYFRASFKQEQIDRYYNKTQQHGDRAGELYGEERLYKASLDPRPNQRYWIECPDGTFVIPPGKNFPSETAEGKKIIPTSEDGVWKWTFERYFKEYNLGNIVFKETQTSALVNQNGISSKWNIYNKLWLKDQAEKGVVPSNLITGIENRQSSKELKELEIPFDFAKPTKFIRYLCEISKTKTNDIILDFFSGSSTTAHAVMRFNSEDKDNRKFIMVQIPEPTPEKSEARKAGYETIAEIGKERIRRAAKKIKEEHPDTQADLGFKVFKLDTSNIKKWQPNLGDLATDLLSAVDNILPDRTSQDLLFEVLIKYGLPLTLPVEQINIQNNGKIYQAWNVANNALIACFDENLTLETIQGIADLSTAENPVLRVVFRDASFHDDITKTNAIQRLKQAGIEDVLSI